MCLKEDILITGSNGQLGSEIMKLSSNYDYDFIFTDVEELDLTNSSYVDAFFYNEQIDICINCAAYTAVDMAESEPDIARKINADAVKNLALACAENETALIHISTDFVFDGHSHSPYTEEDVTNPVSIYGQT
ncbi:SDR family oxidoreductase, partial [Bacteroidota bacterium]